MLRLARIRLCLICLFDFSSEATVSFIYGSHSYLSQSNNVTKYDVCRQLTHTCGSIPGYRLRYLSSAMRRVYSMGLLQG
ncbi:hypothetical protein F5Y10DRAFT_231946 [Nemania abortiva]|nr:hypothetical protein F5Y10DRAFT_231946 [Nemania abortiva]